MRPSPATLRLSIRLTAATIITHSSSSHIGGVFSCADILATLYGSVLRISNGQILDSFILSKGHCCAGVYAALYHLDLLHEDLLSTYGSNGSILMSHISHKVPHVEFSTGSLGHGLPHAVGKAYISLTHNPSKRIYVLLSDGELDEGSNWEAFLFSSHHRLRNLTAIIDYNKLQSLGSVADTLSLEPLEDKFKAFGWNVLLVNGHDLQQLSHAFRSSNLSALPTVIICHTIKGYPVSFMRDQVKWHYSPPTQEQLSIIESELRSCFA